MSDNNNNDASGRLSDSPKYVGPYRILEMLGEGGMAEVYLAEQSEPVKRRVALKMLKAGMDSKQVVARFESERQALAVLDHPNIAKIFDGGIADNGRPYFAMERVKGVAITEYCDDHRLSTQDRLRLFIEVCAAVQHAHLKGLIHRDLKPSNILVAVVDGKPQPKIIDFGIAKATTITLTEATLYTKVGQIVGTPQYMSPEQAGVTGLDVDTRSDIYSLGVILYELLVGAVPLDLSGLGEQAVQLALRERDPATPSARLTQLDDTRDEIAKARGTDPDGLKRQLSGDLDWVVMKAMEKDRTRRYETVNALAMECRRNLRHEPVLARPPSAGYLLGRFVRRNRLVVIAASVAVLAIVAGAAAATVGYIRATEAEQVALREAETANRISDFLVELFEVSDPGEARGNSITAREILDKGASNIESELENQPTVQAVILETIGKVYLNLGLFDDSVNLLQKAQAVGTETFAPADSRLVAIERSLAEAYWATGQYAEAEDILLDVVEKDKASLGLIHKDVAKDLNLLAGLYMRLDRLEDAETFARESIAVRESLFSEKDAETAVGLKTLARILREKGQFPQALVLAKRALDIFDGSLPADHPNIASAVSEVAMNLAEQGFLEEQEPYALRALEMDRRIFGPDNVHVADPLMNVGILYARQKKFVEAEKYFLEALDVTRAALGPVHDSVAFRIYNLGFLYKDMQQYDKAVIHLQHSIEIWSEVFDENHGSVAYPWNALGDIYRIQGRYAEALDAATNGLEINERVHGADHQNTASSTLILANIHRDQRRFAQAKPLYEHVVKVRESVYGAQSSSVSIALSEYLVLLEQGGFAAEAAEIRERIASAEE